MTDELPERSKAATRRKNRKPKLKPKPEPHHYGPVIVYSSIAAGVGMLALIPALVHPASAVAMAIAGGVVAIVGRIWFAAVSPYKDHRGFRLLSGCDESVITSAFRQTKWPWLVQVLGTTVAIMGICAMDIHDEARDESDAAEQRDLQSTARAIWRANHDSKKGGP